MDYGPSLARPVEEPINDPPIVEGPITTRPPARDLMSDEGVIAV